MTLAVVFLIVAAVAVTFAVYFLFGSDRIANRNVLDRQVELLPRRARKGGKSDPMEELINRVFVIDERLVRMKTAMAITLLVAGGFLLIVACALAVR